MILFLFQLLLLLFKLYSLIYLINEFFQNNISKIYFYKLYPN